MAALWDDQASCESFMDDLLTDKRGGRKGFPLDVAQEIASLRDYHFRLHHKDKVAWDHVSGEHAAPTSARARRHCGEHLAHEATIVRDFVSLEPPRESCRRRRRLGPARPSAAFDNWLEVESKTPA